MGEVETERENELMEEKRRIAVKSEREETERYERWEVGEGER